MKRNFLKKIVFSIVTISLMLPFHGCGKDQTEGVSRELTKEEAFKLQVSLSADYFTEGVRPQKALKQGENSGGLSFQKSQETIEWKYPKETMTDEQLLQILSVQYEKVPTDKFTPKEDQLTPEGVEQRVNILLQTFLPDIGSPTDMYMVYIGGNTEVKLQSVDQWDIKMHFEGADNDYSLTISPEDGELISLNRHPQNHYTPEGYNQSKSVEGNNIERTEKEVIESVQKYCGSLTEIIFQIDSALVQNQQGSEITNVSIKTEQGDEYIFSVDQKDLSIMRIQKQ